MLRPSYSYHTSIKNQISEKYRLCIQLRAQLKNEPSSINMALTPSPLRTTQYRTKLSPCQATTHRSAVLNRPLSPTLQHHDKRQLVTRSPMPRPNHLAAAPKQQIVISIERAVSTAPACPALRRTSSTSSTHLMKLRSSGHRTAPRARPYFPRPRLASMPSLPSTAISRNG